MKYSIVATEEGVFAYMREQMRKNIKVSSYFLQNFPLLRSHAEKLAIFNFVRGDVKEVTLEQIYAALAVTEEIDDEQVAKLIELEKKARETLLAQGTVEMADTHPLWLDGLKDDFSAQLIAGAAKNAVTSGNLRGAAKLGATIGAPILMPYVEWILRRSVELGIKRLYFIARDGYILKLMADALIEKLGLKIRTRYIHGSRKAWRMPSYRGLKGELREIVGWSYAQRIRSAEELAETLQISVDTLRPYLFDKCGERGYKFSFAELTFCVMELEKSDEFRNLLKNIMAPKRELVVDYLKQELDTSDDDFAFVELGGGGFTQICLSRIMEEFYHKPIRTFFYKLDRVRTPNKECVFYNFFPSNLKNNLILEMVCRAPEGQTEGYCRNGNKVLPLKKEGEAERYREKGYEDYIRGIGVFTDIYAEAAAKFSHDPSIKTSFACMDFIIRQEDNEIIEFFAGLPNRVTGREDNTPEFAPPLTKKMAQDIFIRHSQDGQSYYPGTDFEMSVKRSSLFIQKKIEKYKSEAWKIRNRWIKMFNVDEQEGAFLSVMSRYYIGNKRVVLYGAGKRGQRWYRVLIDNSIKVAQWLDKDYLKLKNTLPVTGDMDSLGQVPFDCVMVDFADDKLLESITEELQKRGVDEDKIYYPAEISKWINYLSV